MRIYTFDTTLRDGTQGEAISYSVDDKLIIAQKLDDFGIDYIEGGWPGSNPKDKEFFVRARDLKLKHAKLTAFGATRFAKHTVLTDPSVQELANADTPCVTIFGKTWDFHVTRALGIPLEEHVAFLKPDDLSLEALLNRLPIPNRPGALVSRGFRLIFKLKIASVARECGKSVRNREANWQRRFSRSGSRFSLRHRRRPTSPRTCSSRP